MRARWRLASVARLNGYPKNKAADEGAHIRSTARCEPAPPGAARQEASLSSSQAVNTACSAIAAPRNRAWCKRQSAGETFSVPNAGRASRDVWTKYVPGSPWPVLQERVSEEAGSRRRADDAPGVALSTSLLMLSTKHQSRRVAHARWRAAQDTHRRRLISAAACASVARQSEAGLTK